MHYNTKDVLEGGWLQLLWEQVKMQRAPLRLVLPVPYSIYG